MSVEPMHSKQICIVCAEPLPPGALRCNECESFQIVRQCPACGLPTPRHGERCVHCKEYVDGRECRICGASMRENARRCDECKSYQNWRRFFPSSDVTMARIIAFISIVTAIATPLVAYLANHSATHVRVLGVGKVGEEPTIRVQVANTGKRTSYVESARIRFTGIDAEDTDLEVQNPDKTLIAPGKHEVIDFSISGVARLNDKTKPEVLTQVSQDGRVTIEVTVAETGRTGKSFDAKPEYSIKADKLYDWLALRISSQ